MRHWIFGEKHGIRINEKIDLLGKTKKKKKIDRENCGIEAIKSNFKILVVYVIFIIKMGYIEMYYHVL